MQATVHRFDDQTRTGSVLQDDGLEVPFDADAFDESGLRLLRMGQRLTIEIEDGRIARLYVVGIGGGRPIR